MAAFRIGSVTYKSKKGALEAIRSVLRRYADGDRVTDTDAAFLMDVLALHPESELKVGCGVARFGVRRTEQGSICFDLTRIDGTTTDWSFMSCLNPPTPEKEAKAAFRSEIEDQLITYRDARFRGATHVPCAITNEPVECDRAHIDHAPPTFLELTGDFTGRKGLRYADIQVEPTRDNETRTVLLDRQLAADWHEFHRKHAVLRIVTIRANLSLLRRKAP